MDIDRYASASLMASIPSEEPAPTAVPANESPAAAAEGTPPVEPAPESVQTPGTDDPDAEPSPEVLATLNEAGQRALKAERQQSKEARAKVRELQAQLDQLQSPPPPAEPAAPAPAAVEPPPAPVTPSVPPSLAACHSLEAVDARVQLAVAGESTATELILALQRNERDTVLQGLRAEGIEAIGETPLDQASDAQISSLLVKALRNAKTEQLAAPQRKTLLMQTAENWNRVAEVLPELKDQKSPVWQKMAQIVQTRPELRSRADGPLLAAKLYLGELAWNAKLPQPAAATATAPAPPPSAKPVIPPLRSAPGAPRTTVAAAPVVSERDQITERIDKGTATLADIDRLGALSVNVSA